MKKSHNCLFLVLLLLVLALETEPFIVGAQTTMEIAVATDKQEYYQRDHVVISGSLSILQQPVSDTLVGLEAIDSLGKTIAYRALSTGGTPTVEGTIDIREVTSIDPNTGQPKVFFKIGTTSAFKVVVENTGFESVALLTLSIFDGNMVSLGSAATKLTLPRGDTTWQPSIPIDQYAYIGPAKAVANVFTDYPNTGGSPRCLEATGSFGIVRGDISVSSVPPPAQEPTPQNGTFSTTFRLGPEIPPGVYSVYASARKGLVSALDSVSFQVKSSRLDVPSPPQASFTFVPLRAYVTAPVLFDALASSPENFNDNVTSYEWSWGDGSPKNLTTTPSISHRFSVIGTYNVTLKVTDIDSWCTIVKPVTINPPDPPVADFVWSPRTPVVNYPTRFNASASLPGWDGVQSFPIVNYRWNFGDGNVTSVSVPVIYHTYAQNITYNVNLTVTDTSGRQGSKTYALKISSHMEGDINGDGKVDGKDIAIAAKAYGTTPGDPLWDARADVNGDDKVDGRDIAIISKHFGEIVTLELTEGYTATSFVPMAVVSIVSPPQASFTFIPLRAYAKTYVVFDASISSPENFNDNITSYEWTWGDGSPKDVTVSPLFSHKFSTVGTYNVTLRVTDHDAWAITRKPITLLPPDPPQADFVWTPDPPRVNRAAKFDASTSRPGWNGTIYVPIVSYRWNFGDGNTTTVSVPVIYHTYAQNITYSVTLTVTDSNGLQGSKMYSIKVENRLVADVNNDGKVDGKDIAIAAKAYGTQPGDPLWDARADVNLDGKVDGKDIAIISKNFGQVG